MTAEKRDTPGVREALSRWRGHASRRSVMLAALTFAGLSTAAIAPSAASASTDGFHVYNWSQYPIQLQGISGDFAGGHPSNGSVLYPGNGFQDFELTYNFARSTFGSATYGPLNGSAGQNIVAGFEVGGSNTVNAGCQLIGAPGVCTPGALTKGQSNVYYEDAPGTVVNLPASDAQARADLLKRQCVNGNASNCQFALTGETEFDSPSHQVGKALINNTSEKQNFSIEASDSVASSNSVNVGTEVGGKIADLVSVKVSASYSHTWETSHTFGQTVDVTCKAYSKCWVSAVQPMYRDTGNFTLTLGNTTWNLPGVYFDSPNPSGNGSYQVDQTALTPSEQASLPKGVSSPLTAVRSSYRMRSRSPIATPKLALALSGPKRVNAGARAVFEVRLTRSQAGRRASYAVGHVQLHGSRGTPIGSWRVDSLPVDRVRTMRLGVRVPKSAHDRLCFTVSARARHAHSAHARWCGSVTDNRG